MHTCRYMIFENVKILHLLVLWQMAPLEDQEDISSSDED